MLKQVVLITMAAVALPVLAQPNVPVDAGALKRAEVLADLDLWNAAGMPLLAAEAELGLDLTTTSEYRTYTELRRGPQFAAAVERHLGQASAVAGQPANGGAVGTAE